MQIDIIGQHHHPKMHLLIRTTPHKTFQVHIMFGFKKSVHIFNYLYIFETIGMKNLPANHTDVCLHFSVHVNVTDPWF